MTFLGYLNWITMAFKRDLLVEIVYDIGFHQWSTTAAHGNPELYRWLKIKPTIIICRKATVEHNII